MSTEKLTSPRIESIGWGKMRIESLGSGKDFNSQAAAVAGTGTADNLS